MCKASRYFSLNNVWKCKEGKLQAMDFSPADVSRGSAPLWAYRSYSDPSTRGEHFLKFIFTQLF